MSRSEHPPICDYEGSTYRTDFWKNRGREYEDGAERIALRALLPASGKRLLDIGAGFGRLAPLYDGYEQVVLLDYSHSQLAYARRALGDKRYIYVAADVYQLPLVTNAVDVAVMVRVLHHIVNVPDALAQISRVLLPNGTFVLEHANKRHLKNILRYLIGRGVNPFGRQPYEFAELHYDFHPAWVREQLEQAEFEVKRRRSVSLLRLKTLKQMLPIRFLLGCERLLQRPLAPLALSPSIFLSTISRASRSDQGLAEPDVLFRCIACGYAPLRSDGEGVCCPRCGRRWPIVDGVYLFK